METKKTYERLRFKFICLESRSILALSNDDHDGGWPEGWGN